MAHTEDEYNDFERTLDLYFNRWSFKGKKELKLLMSNAGFRRKKVNGVTQIVNVNQNQIDYAWDYYQSKLTQSELPMKKNRVETYGNRQITRATYEQEINGKVYKKGWFLPKRR